MDIITHAVAGAYTGSFFGHPIAGAIAGIAADLPIMRVKRYPSPPPAYNATHSLAAAVIVGIAGYALYGNAGLFLAYLSHLYLDLFTHGKEWGSMLLYPLPKRFSFMPEWEFFNSSFYLGLFLAVLWSVLLCLILK